MNIILILIDYSLFLTHFRSDAASNIQSKGCKALTQAQCSVRSIINNKIVYFYYFHYSQWPNVWLCSNRLKTTATLQSSALMTASIILKSHQKATQKPPEKWEEVYKRWVLKESGFFSYPHSDCTWSNYWEACVYVCVTEMVGSYRGTLCVQHSLLLTGSGQWGRWGWGAVTGWTDRVSAGENRAVCHLFWWIQYFIE